MAWTQLITRSLLHTSTSAKRQQAAVVSAGVCDMATGQRGVTLKVHLRRLPFLLQLLPVVVEPPQTHHPALETVPVKQQQRVITSVRSLLWNQQLPTTPLPVEAVHHLQLSSQVLFGEVVEHTGVHQGLHEVGAILRQTQAGQPLVPDPFVVHVAVRQRL